MKNNIKKALKVIGLILTVACAVASAWMTAKVFYNDELYWSECERFNYIVLAGTFLVFFAYFSKKMSKLWGKLLLGFTHSALYIVTMFFENAYFQCIYMNNLFKDDPEITYAESIKTSWDYYFTMGSPHYILAFLAMLALCALIILWGIPKIVKFRRKILSRFYNLIGIPDENKEFTSVEEAVIELDKVPTLNLIRYLVFLENTDENKQELIRCAEKYKSENLYCIIFNHHKEMLTKEEYIKLRTDYLKIEDETISFIKKRAYDHVREADEYYGIENTDK